MPQSTEYDKGKEKMNQNMLSDQNIKMVILPLTSHFEVRLQ